MISHIPLIMCLSLIINILHIYVYSCENVYVSIYTCTCCVYVIFPNLLKAKFRKEASEDQEVIACSVGGMIVWWHHEFKR